LTDRRREALIIGAGIGGLACALALQRAGWRVRVLERASELQEIGAGLTLSPNATRALGWLGVLDSLRGVLSLPPYQVMEDPESGREIGRFTRGARALEEYGGEYAFVHRADLQAGLATAVRRRDPDAIEVGRDCVEVLDGGDGVAAVFADGSELRGDLLVGCDGIRSRVRAALHPDESPRYTGYVAWRALIPYSRVAASALPAGSAVVYGPRKVIVRYRLEPRRLLNVAAFAQRVAWTEEGWNVPADPAEPQKLFADWHAGVRDTLAALTPGELFRWGLFDREPIDAYARGAIALLGDAAHPMLPFLGQGAALALEDAVVLARALAAEPAIPRALERYDALRRPRGSEAVLESRAAARRLHGEEGDPRTRNEQTLDYYRYDAGAVEV
jgi:salicylate hydroxylase